MTHQDERCPRCGKVPYAAHGQAFSAARIYERDRGLEPKAMGVYPCGDVWHVGHQRIRHRLGAARGGYNLSGRRRRHKR